MPTCICQLPSGTTQTFICPESMPQTAAPCCEGHRMLSAQTGTQSARTEQCPTECVTSTIGHRVDVLHVQAKPACSIPWPQFINCCVWHASATPSVKVWPPLPFAACHARCWEEACQALDASRSDCRLTSAALQRAGADRCM